MSDVCGSGRLELIRGLYFLVFVFCWYLAAHSSICRLSQPASFPLTLADQTSFLFIFLVLGRERSLLQLPVSVTGLLSSQLLSSHSAWRRAGGSFPWLLVQSFRRCQLSIHCVPGLGPRAHLFLTCLVWSTRGLSTLAHCAHFVGDREPRPCPTPCGTGFVLALPISALGSPVGVHRDCCVCPEGGSTFKSLRVLVLRSIAVSGVGL